MMKIEIPSYGRMNQTGKSLLNLIQAKEMSLLDLLVRESIQNSLDASLPDSCHVDVNFILGSFDVFSLAGRLENIGESFKKRYSFNDSAEFLAVCDSKTFGLTGPLHYKFKKENEDYGNLLKLVYEISRPQEKEGAGGSWGLGKTVYFRMGIGLVIYYSRIRNENGFFEERLAATFVEDQTKSDALLRKWEGNNPRGLAWWGEKIGDNETQPVTDKEYINEFLEIFSLKPYQGEQTGTTIIIPFIKRENLLERSLRKDDDHFLDNSLESFLKTSIQRWYAPRLMNFEYNGTFLRAFINGEGIKNEEIIPFFKKIQELYKGIESKDFKKHDILLRGTLDEEKAGFFSYVILDKEKDLKTASGPYIEIQKLLNSFEEDIPVIVAYTRNPGMIVNYETNGKWARRYPQIDGGKILLGLFVLNSENTLKKTNISLEEYIRGGEQGEHSSWNDRYILESGNMTIVKRIQDNIHNKIKNDLSKENELDRKTEKNVILGKKLAYLFMPHEGFGIRPTLPEKNRSKGETVRKKNKKSQFKITGSGYHNNYKYFDFILDFADDSFEETIELFVIGETSKIPIIEWESPSEIGRLFPVNIVLVEVNKEKKENIRINKNYFDLDISIVFQISSIYKTRYAVKITRKNKRNKKIQGKIFLEVNDKRNMISIERLNK